MTETPALYWPKPFRAIVMANPAWDEASLRGLAQPAFDQGALEVEVRRWPGVHDTTILRPMLPGSGTSTGAQ